MGKLDWLKENLKVGEIKITGVRAHKDGAPNARGVMRLHDGQIYEISMWTTRVSDTKKILTGKVYSEDEVKKILAKLQDRSMNDGIDDLIP